MNKAAYPLKLPNSIKQAAPRLGKEDGVPEPVEILRRCPKVGSIETAADFFKQRATRRQGAGLMRLLVNALDVLEERGTKQRLGVTRLRPLARQSLQGIGTKMAESKRNVRRARRSRTQVKKSEAGLAPRSKWAAVNP
jgi:hypothetical protein